MTTNNDFLEAVSDTLKKDAEYVQRFDTLSFEDKDVLIEDLEREVTILREYYNIVKKTDQKTINQDIPAGSVVYWNKRYQKWYTMKKGFKENRKLLGVMTKDGDDIQTSGWFTIEIGKEADNNKDD